MAIQTAPYIWHRGQVVPWDEANVHVLAHGLHYGTSIFEGIRAYEKRGQPHFFRLKDHLDRFVQSARIHRMPLQYSVDDMKRACEDLIEANNLTAAYIRPIGFYDYGGLGVHPDPSSFQVSIAAFPWGAYLGESALKNGVSVQVSTWRRPAPNTHPSLAKAGGNYLLSALMTGEAKRLGFDEAIALDSRGFLSEGPGENLFLVKDGVLFTPSIESALLAGITRDSVMTLAQALGFQVKEATLPRDFLYAADELFFTGTAAEVTPIRAVDGLEVGNGKPGPITSAIQTAFFELIGGERTDDYDWFTTLSRCSVEV